MNKERVRRLIKQGRMTPAGLVKAKDAIGSATAHGIVISPDILRALRQDRKSSRNFTAFPQTYKRIRIEWIEMARSRPEIFRQRLRYFLKMTAKNKRFGMGQ
ncbi:MAG: YdeI/OmpD-associated family protein [Armatimonadetes bacterium]|nr:YdeI/OmpD-associated family protein [Armatimonadota bacterium]